MSPQRPQIYRTNLMSCAKPEHRTWPTTFFSGGFLASWSCFWRLFG